MPGDETVLPEHDAEFARVWRIAEASGLPGLEIGRSYGKPSLKVAGKFLGWVREPNMFVVRCPREMKEMLIAARPDVYFDTDHHRGSSYAPIRLDRASDADLDEAIRRGWADAAPVKIKRQLKPGASP